MGDVKYRARVGVAVGAAALLTVVAAPAAHADASGGTLLDGAGDGWGDAQLTGFVIYSFEFDLTGTYQGTPASGAWSCTSSAYYAGSTSALQCSQADDLLNDAGVGQVMPASFTISGVAFTLTPDPSQSVAAWTLTGSALSGTLRCGGFAQGSPGTGDTIWYLTAPDVSCTLA